MCPLEGLGGSYSPNVLEVVGAFSEIEAVGSTYLPPTLYEGEEPEIELALGWRLCARALLTELCARRMLRSSSGMSP